MQAHGAVRGGVITAIPPPRRGRRNVLVAILVLVVVAPVVALLVWAAPFATSSGVGAEDAAPGAGSAAAVVHDDAWNMHPTAAGAGSAIVHDDAGTMHRSTDVHP
jgi:ferric-dicitrate binding protein FerR (iron transport regulator)